MSRSRKRHFIFKNAGRSDKRAKHLCNRAFRHLSRVKLLQDKSILPECLDEIMSEWNFPSDGKHYWHTPPARAIRK